MGYVEYKELLLLFLHEICVFGSLCKVQLAFNPGRQKPPCKQRVPKSNPLTRLNGAFVKRRMCLTGIYLSRGGGGGEVESTLKKTTYS